MLFIKHIRLDQRHSQNTARMSALMVQNKVSIGCLDTKLCVCIVCITQQHITMYMYLLVFNLTIKFD